MPAPVLRHRRPDRARSVFAIETSGLAKTFRKRRPLPTLLWKPWARALRVQALADVDLRVAPGSVFGVLGANGAGKTTLIRVLASLIRQSRGTVRVNGLDPLTQGRRVRASIGLVPPEDRSLYWRLTGRENLRFFARLHGLEFPRAAGRIGEVLRLVEIEDRADDPVLSYSSGMRQRLAVARALLHDPPILFLDEPTRSLDPHAAKHLRRFVRDRLNREAGKTVLLATHNLAEAEELCDRLAVLRAGRVIAEGSPGAVAARAGRGQFYDLTVRAPAGPAAGDFPGEPLEDGLLRIRLEIPAREGALGERLEDLIRRGFRIVRCQPSEHPLQAAFDDPQAEGES